MIEIVIKMGLSFSPIFVLHENFPYLPRVHCCGSHGEVLENPIFPMHTVTVRNEDT